MSLAKKITVTIALLIILAVGAAALYYYHFTTGSLPDYDSSVDIEGLTGEVIIYRDAHAIPHIYAGNDSDLYRATGYVMAQDRLWQMDLVRRVTDGTLSEIFGADFIGADHLLRALRIPDKSRAALKTMDSQDKSILEAFSEGVNQYLEHGPGRLPPEFSILGYEPEPWKPEHCLNLIGYMAWDLTMPWGIELKLHRIRQKVGEELFKEILPDLESQKSFVYPGFSAEKAVLTDTLVSLFEETPFLRHRLPAVFNGSNNWVVSGARSTTGMPIFANDMHLGFGIPGIWYPIHQCIEGEVNVTGLAIPGQPCVVAGHNDYIAWGMTNVMVDDMDFYLEKINPDNPDEYEMDGAWRPMEIRREEIRVKDGETVEKMTRFTHRGPIVSEFKSLGNAAVSMRGIGNEKSNENKAVYKMNRARNWDEFRDAASDFVSVSQNIAYADVEGNIGLQCAAGVPVRELWNGVEVVPGWTGEYDWKGLVPFEDLPYIFNPASGFVSSANNRSLADDAPVFIPQWPALHYRIDRIRELLSEKEKLSVDDFKRIQSDHTSLLVIEKKAAFVEEIENAAKQSMREPDGTDGEAGIGAGGGGPGLSAVEREALALLAGWDGNATIESVGALIFEEFYRNLTVALMRDEMGEELFNEYLGSGYLVRFAVNQLWRTADSPWWDNTATPDVRETKGEITLAAFRTIVGGLTERIGPEPSTWKWGSEHTLTLRHPLGKVETLDKLFRLNRGPFPVPGSGHTVSPYTFSYKDPYNVIEGSSHRHIYTPGDWNSSQTIIPTGVSGIPASRFYCDQTELYLQHEYHKDFVTRGQVESNAEYKMVLY